MTTTDENDTLKWLCETLRGETWEGQTRQNLSLTSDQVQSMLTCQPGDDRFHLQYQEFLQAVRENLTITMLGFTFTSSSTSTSSSSSSPSSSSPVVRVSTTTRADVSPILDALCSLLPALDSLYLTLTLDAAEMAAATRVLSIASQRQGRAIRSLDLDVSWNPGQTLDLGTTVRFVRALQQCSHLETFQFELDDSQLPSYDAVEDFPAQMHLLMGNLFPQLKTLTLERRNRSEFPCNRDIIGMIVRHCVTLETLTLSRLILHQNDHASLLTRSLEASKNLKKLLFYNCQIKDNIQEIRVTALAQAIAKLDDLLFEECDFPICFFNALGDSFAERKDRMNSLDITLGDSERFDSTFRPIVRGLCRTGVGCLDLHAGYESYEEDPVDMTELLDLMVTLLTSTRTEKLRLAYFPPRLDTPTVVQTIIRALESDTTCLTCFSYSCTEHFSDEDFLKIVAAAAAGQQSCRLQELVLAARPSHETCVTALSYLQNNKTLVTLKAEHPQCPLFSSGDSDSDNSHEKSIFLEALARNFYLQNINQLYPSENYDDIHAIMRLNKAGRCYLVDETLSMAAKVEKGVEVLIQVNDDLDCSFYHLRENPELCNYDPRYHDVAAAVPSNPHMKECEEAHRNKKRKQLF